MCSYYMVFESGREIKYVGFKLSAFGDTEHGKPDDRKMVVIRGLGSRSTRYRTDGFYYLGYVSVIIN